MCVCVGICKGDFRNYQLWLPFWGSGGEKEKEIFPSVFYGALRNSEIVRIIYVPQNQTKTTSPVPWRAFPLPLASAGIRGEHCPGVLRVVLSYILAPQSSSLPVRKQHSITGNTSFSPFLPLMIVI